MSDQITAVATETIAPNTEAGQAVDQPVTEQATPQPFATFPDAKSFEKRMERETRKALNAKAKEAGFDDWQDMQDSAAATRQPPAATPTPEAAAPAATPAQPDEASRLRMALQVGTEMNLPTALVARLQGSTAEEMKADAEALMGLFAAPQRVPGIPPAPTQNQPVTFTRKQLQDPAYVRAHGAEIMQAAREGRIRDS